MATPKWASVAIRAAKAQKAVRLDLRYYPQFGEPLTEIPVDIFEMTKLEKLDLGDNKIKKLPQTLKKLPYLTSLVLNGNKSIDLSSWLGDFQNLRWLGLSELDITSLPDFVTRLTNLIELNLAANQLVDLPNSIKNLQNLKWLNLGQNSLHKLPEPITELKKLEYLNLESNQIVSLPDSIIKLQNLTHLNLKNNQLKAIPESITYLKKVIWLSINGNSLVTPPLEVVHKGFIAIRDYYRQLEEQGQDKLYEAKLLILGEGGAGKTTLAQKIVDPTYQLRDEKSTEGVDVLQWGFSMDNGRNFRINIWDFGGQEIYHATHQFFLTKRSLYALVADTRKEDTDFYYWLNVVELLSDNSPLLIIKNEKQDRHREINERQLRGQFENLEAIIPVNLATNRGLHDVLLEIQHYAEQLPHIGSPLPKTWVRVREALEKNPHNYISLDEYFDICRENGFVKIKDSMQLSGYLHDIGVFLHFLDDALLRKTVILKPKWGTDAAYKVLDNKKVIKNLGKFTRDDLTTIWNEIEYANMHDELLQLMMKFKLCYQIPNTSGIYIAPQLLTENQPNYLWNDKENLLLRYTYDFMPKGILMQFIVAMHQHIAIIEKQAIVWKSGVVIAKDQTTAEIIEHYGKRQLYIRITGAHKKELMTIIMYELDKIHSTYARLKYDKLIPCNCTECRTKAEPYFYRYEVLQKFIEDKQEQIQCQQSYQMVSVRGLIDDVIQKESSHEEREAPLIQNIYYGDHIDQGERKMAKINQTIKDSTVYGSVVAAESIQDSFNIIEKASIKDDLKEQLKLLTQAVEAMTKELPKEQAEEVAEDMKVLAEQATKEKPNPKWYNVSIDGLIAAAQNLGNIGDAVIELTGKVRKILTGGLL